MERLKNRALLVFSRVILITDAHPTALDKIKYSAYALAHIAPIVFLAEWLQAWVRDNAQFGLFMMVAMTVNMMVGVWFHLKYRTFNFKEFLLKNTEMMGVMIVVYVMLEMLRYTAGDNLAGEVFRIFIQVLTLLYPTSKVMKNIFIISNGRHPPKFIMYRLYNFEKYGDLEGFFKTKKDENNNNDDDIDGHLDELLDLQKKDHPEAGV